MKLSKLYKFVEDKIGGAFASYGRFVSRHAWKIIAIVVIVNIGLGIGILNLQSDLDVGSVYLPQGSRSRDDQEIMDNTFPDLSGSNYNSLQETSVEGLYARVIVTAKSGQLLSRTKLEELRDLNTIIQGITAKSDGGSTFSFDSLCAKAYNACVVEGYVFWQDEYLAAVDGNTVTYPEFNLTGYGTVSYGTLVGGAVKMDTNGQYLESVEYILIKYTFRTDGDNFEDLATKWVEAFTQRLNAYSSAELDIAYGHFKSLDTEIDANISGDIALFAATIFLMSMYAGFATLTYRVTDQVRQRVMLGFAGIIAAGLAILASFGFCAAIGVDYVSIVGVIPFLILGIGIDDMFIMLSGLSGAQTKLTVEDKVAEMLRASGVGITITSLTDFIAFMAGAGSSFIAVRNFCIYTGVAVVFCYINNITFFAACITINERRVADNRHYFTCRRIKYKEELRDEGKSKSYVMCCGGSPPRNRNEAESMLDKFPRWLFPKIVLNLPCKIIIIVVFLGYLAGAIYGCINLKQGLLFTQLVSDDSYFYKYSQWLEDNFNSRQIPVSFVTTRTYTYTDANTKTLIDNLVTRAQADGYFDDTFEVSWLNTYMSTAYYDGSSEANFITGLQSFVSDTAYRRFENDVVINSAGTKITASRIHLMSSDLADSQEQGAFMLKARDIADSDNFDCFAYNSAFVAFEQYVAILGQSLQTVGIALAAVFVITCIFMPHPILIIFVTVAVLMIMLGVFGYIYYIDVALSSITMIHLIMSVGFSIDFTAHICHGYMISTAKTRDVRVRHAIDQTGAPIFHGAVSSLIGIVILVIAKSYVFRTFAAVMALVLLFGIAHALLLLPVLLSWIGPASHITDDDETDGKTDGKHINEDIAMDGIANTGMDMNDEKIKPKTNNHDQNNDHSPTHGKQITSNQTSTSNQTPASNQIPTHSNPKVSPSEDDFEFHKNSQLYDIRRSSSEQVKWTEHL